MIDQLKRDGIVLLVCLAVVLLLAVMSDYASGACGAMTPRAGRVRTKLESGSRSLYTVSRGTTIQSERPIGLLIAELGLGYWMTIFDGDTAADWDYETPAFRRRSGLTDLPRPECEAWHEQDGGCSASSSGTPMAKSAESPPLQCADTTCSYPTGSRMDGCEYA